MSVLDLYRMAKAGSRKRKFKLRLITGALATVTEKILSMSQRCHHPPPKRGSTSDSFLTVRISGKPAKPKKNVIGLPLLQTVKGKLNHFLFGEE